MPKRVQKRCFWSFFGPKPIYPQKGSKKGQKRPFFGGFKPILPGGSFFGPKMAFWSKKGQKCHFWGFRKPEKCCHICRAFLAIPSNTRVPPFWGQKRGQKRVFLGCFLGHFKPIYPQKGCFLTPKRGPKRGQKRDFGQKGSKMATFGFSKTRKVLSYLPRFFGDSVQHKGTPFLGSKKGPKRVIFDPFLGCFQANLPPKGVFFDPFWTPFLGVKKCKKGGDHRLPPGIWVPKRVVFDPKKGPKTPFLGFCENPKSAVIFAALF